MVRLITYGKVKKMISQFEDTNIDNFERNMMRGMYRRKLKDFAEMQKEQRMSLLDRFLGQSLRLSGANLETDDSEVPREFEGYRMYPTVRRLIEPLEAS